MLRKSHTDIVEIVSHFQRDILDQKPPVSEMYNEIRMMKFKIKPLQGDISLLNLSNAHFIEILWSLGKLDEFFQDHYKKIAMRKRDLFLRLFDEIHEKFQDQLNALNLKPERVGSSSMFEMEIFKERSAKPN